MTSAFSILADGIPPGAIFGAVVFVLWLLGAITSKGKTTPTHQPSAEAEQLAAVRRRMLEQQAEEKRAVQGRGRGKGKRKVAPPPLPTPAVVRQPWQPATAAPSAPRVPNEIGAASTSRARTSETTGNVRLLLQRGGAAEAFIFGEILGKPKALRDD